MVRTKKSRNREKKKQEKKRFYIDEDISKIIFKIFFGVLFIFGEMK